MCKDRFRMIFSNYFNDWALYGRKFKRKLLRSKMEKSILFNVQICSKETQH